MFSSEIFGLPTFRRMAYGFDVMTIKEFVKHKIPGRGGKRGYHGQRARLEYRHVHQPGKRQRDDNVGRDFKNDRVENPFSKAFI